MNEEHEIMDSLLKEHAKTKGVDEKFLKELELRLDAEELGNVIPLNLTPRSSSASKRGLGLGLGVAACAALYAAGTFFWNNQKSDEVIALDSGAAIKQMENAKEDLLLMESVETNALEPQKMLKLSKEKSVPAIESATTDKKPAIFFAPVEAPVIAAESTNEANSLPVPQSADLVLEKKAESVDLAKANFGNGGGGGEMLGGRVAGAGIAAGGCVVRGAMNLPVESDLHGVKTKHVLPAKDLSGESYGKLIDNDFIAPVDKATRLSTFAIDVDTASYANLRRMINTGDRVPVDAVRIEEMINYFDYQYAKPAPDAEHPFAVYLDAADCPWNRENKLVRVALQGKAMLRAARPASNVVFLIDVSGSMDTPDKLPLLKDSLKYLLEELNEKDTISIVVYAGASGVVLPATKVDHAGRAIIMKSLENLCAGGSTAGGEGIKLAYQIAQANMIKDGVNRVILATDGDFNVGISDDAALTDLVKERAAKGVDLSVLGFGTGNLNDKMLEMITNNGNGNYSYIDSIKEGRKVLLEDMMGTLVTIAKDVKIQVEFNPEKVKEYRLIGYSNRMLSNEAFLDKKADAGEIGAGHRVTALYEIVPGKAFDKKELGNLRYTKTDALADKEKKSEVPVEHADELLYVKLAYKRPDQKVSDESTYLSVELDTAKNVKEMVDPDFKFASSLALFGMVLRDSEHRGNGDLDLAQKLAESGKGADGKGMREEFIQMIKKMKDRNPELRIQK